ncbi:MAG: pyridoxal phosphate-dependent aminotransferase [Candidatus Wallbacteria bacterium]|nr:pyridoxal phosphate-dependent aminotransferase [Candidatus Wallbacteria bacterium]
MPSLSNRTRALGTENAFVVLKEVKALQAQGKDILNFCIGQPDFPTPTNICEAGCRAIREGKTGYTPSAGIPELREAIAKEVARTRNIAVSPDDVVVAAGAKPFIGYSVLSVTDPGRNHEVLYPNPGFPIYSSQIGVHGAVPVPMFLDEARGFTLDLDRLESQVTAGTRMIILNSPQNPTGGILGQSDLEAIAAIAQRHDLWVYSDEPYSRIVFDGAFRSIASIPGMAERTLLVDGLSKTYSMPGWRLGYAVNRALAPAMSNWVTNTESCAAHMVQWAALEAISGPQDDVKRMVDSFHARRDLIADGLNKLDGIRCHKPGGAFYVWPNVTELCHRVGAADSDALRKMLLHDAGVAVLSDVHFGLPPQDGSQHIRFSYAASTQDITRALERIADFAAKRCAAARRK